MVLWGSSELPLPIRLTFYHYFSHYSHVSLPFAGQRRPHTIQDQSILSLSLIKNQTTKAYRTARIVPIIFKLDIKWMYVVNFTTRSLYSRENIHRYPLNRRLHRLHIERSEQKKSLLLLLGIEKQFLYCSLRSRLIYPDLCHR